MNTIPGAQRFPRSNSIIRSFLLDGFAQKSATQLYKAIQNTKTARLDRLLYALGIRHVGQHVAQILARTFPSLEALRKTSQEELEATADVGPEIAASVQHFFAHPENQQVLDRLLQAGIQIEEMPTRSKELPWQGQTFVFTGKLKRYTRKEAKEKVERLGARVTSRVSSHTDIVVAGQHPGQKLEEAKKQGIQIFDEEAFVQYIQETSS